MAYCWVTQAQEFIQGLGFGTPRAAPVNMKSQAHPAQPAGRGQLVRHRADKDELRFGKGGVDDAEDAEVILPRYSMPSTSPTRG